MRILHMALNGYVPYAEIEDAIYEVLADGQLFTCESPKMLPTAHRHLWFKSCKLLHT
jgi:urease alpha subunit